MVSSLEEDVVIMFGGVNRKIVEIRGTIKFVEGFDEKYHAPILHRTLRILLNPTTFDNQNLPYFTDNFLLKFDGPSPVKRGDNVRIGLISKNEVRTNWSESPENVKDWNGVYALYVGIVDDDDSWKRRDFTHGYNPTHDREKLGLED